MIKIVNIDKVSLTGRRKMPELKYVSDKVRLWLAENADKYSDSLVTRCGIVFGIDRRTAYYHLKRLIDNGAMRATGENRWMRYELVDMSKVYIERKVKSKKVRNTETSDQLISLMNVNDLSISDVSRLTGFNERSVYVWLKPPDDRLWVPAHVCAVRLLEAYSELGKLKAIAAEGGHAKAQDELSKYKATELEIQAAITEALNESIATN